MNIIHKNHIDRKYYKFLHYVYDNVSFLIQTPHIGKVYKFTSICPTQKRTRRFETFFFLDFFTEWTMTPTNFESEI